MSPRSCWALVVAVLALSALVLPAQAQAANEAPSCFASSPGLVPAGETTPLALWCDDDAPVADLDMVVEQPSSGVGSFDGAPYYDADEDTWFIDYTANDHVGDESFTFYAVDVELEESIPVTEEFEVVEDGGGGPGGGLECSDTDTNTAGIQAPPIVVRTNHSKFIFPPCAPGSYESLGNVVAPSSGTFDPLPDFDDGFIFTPAHNSDADVTLTYDLLDFEGGTTPVTQPITVGANENGAPFCVPDADPYEVTVGDTDSIITDCFDPDDDLLTITGPTAGTAGRVTFGRPERSDGSFDLPFTGVAPGTTTVDWTVTDGRSAAVAGTRNVVVAAAPPPPPNTAPQCFDENANGFVGMAVDVTPSCFDEDGDDVTFSLGSSPTGGFVTGGEVVIDNAQGRVTFTPTNASVTSANFGLVANDGHGHPVPVQVNVTLGPLPTPSCSTPSTVTIRTGTTRGFQPSCTGFVSGARTYALTDNAGGRATLVNAATGAISFTSATPGAFAFSYTVTQDGRTSQARTQNVTVSNTHNARPSCGADDSAPDGDGVALRQNATREITVSCFDLDGDAMTIGHSPHAPQSGPTFALNGTLSGLAQETVEDHAFATVTYDPDNTFTGTAGFDWTVSETGPGQADGLMRTFQKIRVRSAASNHAPQCDPDQHSGSARAGDPRPLFVECDDPDGDPITFTTVTAPAHGTASPFTVDPADPGAGTSTYTATAGYVGGDEVVVTATDGKAISRRVAIPIDVKPNQAPECEPPAGGFRLEVPAGTSRDLTSLDCFDEEGDLVTYEIADPAAQGTATAIAGGLRYAANANANPANDDTFTFRAVDDYQPSAESGEYEVTVDVQPAPPGPAVTLGTITPNTQFTNNRTRQFAFTSPDSPGVTFSCERTGGSAAACTSPHTVTLPQNAADGPYTFSVRGTKNNVQGPAATHTWTLDTAAPATGSVAGGPAGSRTKQTSLTFGPFTTTGTEVAPVSFECSLKVGSAAQPAFQACGGTSKTLSGLTNGTAYRLEVRAVDTAGNVDATPSVREWTVDTAAPTLTLTPNPQAQLTNQAARTFTFGSSETGSTFTCKLDDGTAEACTSPRTVTIPAGAQNDGQHTFTVVATDPAGNETAPQTHTWTLDRVAPVMNALTGGPAEGTRVASSTATFGAPGSDTQGATFRCSKKAGSGAFPAPAACPSPLTYAGLADGAHALRVTAVDAAGNESAHVERTWTVDTTGPALSTFTMTPATSPTNSGEKDFAWSSTASDLAGTDPYTCTLTRAGSQTPLVFAGACDGSLAIDVDNVADDTYTLTVRAKDDLGNLGLAQSRSFVLDQTAPDTKIVSAPFGTTSSDRVRVVGGSNEAGATVQCRVEPAVAFGACPAGTSFPDGTYTVHVRATDQAGNVDQSPASRTFTIDSSATGAVSKGEAAPDAPLSTGDTSGAPSASQPAIMSVEPPFATEITVTESETPSTSEPSGFGLLGYEYDFDAPALENPLPAGQRIELEFLVHKDKLPATVTAANLGSIEVFRDGQLLPDCPSSGGLPAACVLSRSARPSPANFQGVLIRVSANHLSKWNFGVDDVAPSVTVGGHSGEDADGDVAFTYTASEAGVTFECRMDGGGVEACGAGGKSYAGLADGAHTFAVRARDGAGNLGAFATRDFTVKRPVKKDDGQTPTTPGGGTTPVTPVTPRPPVTTPRPAAGLSVSLLSSPAQKLAAALKSGVTMAFQCSGACSVNATLSIPGALAKKLKLAKNAKKPVVVARGRGSGSGRVAVKFAFTAKAKKALRRQRSLRLTVAGTATGSGVPVPLRGALTVKR